MRFAHSLIRPLCTSFLLVMLGTSAVAGAYPLAKSAPLETTRLLFSKVYFQTAIESALKGDLPLATELMGKVSRLNPTNYQFALNYGEFLRTNQDYTRAEALYRVLLQQFPQPEQQMTTYYQLAMVLEAQKRTPEALSAIESALAVSQTPSAQLWYDAGILYAKLGQYEKTRACSQKAVSLMPNFGPAWNNLGYSLAKLGQLKDGLQAVNQALTINPSDANALDSKGYILFKQGRYQDAIGVYQQALVLNPRQAETYLFLGLAYEATRALPEALDALQNYVQLAPNSPETQTVQAKIQTLKAALSSPGGAQESLQRLVEPKLPVQAAPDKSSIPPASWLPKAMPQISVQDGLLQN